MFNKVTKVYEPTTSAHHSTLQPGTDQNLYSGGPLYATQTAESVCICFSLQHFTGIVSFFSLANQIKHTLENKNCGTI